MTVEEMARDPRVTIGIDHTTTSKGDRESTKTPKGQDR